MIEPTRMLAESTMINLAKMLIQKAEQTKYVWIEIGLKKISLRDESGIEILTLNSEELGIGAILTIWPTFQRATMKRDTEKLIVFEQGKTADVLNLNKFNALNHENRTENQATQENSQAKEEPKA